MVQVRPLSSRCLPKLAKRKNPENHKKNKTKAYIFLLSQVPEMNISYKPQTIAPKFEGTVRELLHEKCAESWMSATFTSEVTKPMKLDHIIDNEVQKLSGG